MEEKTEKGREKGVSAAMLHVLAMALMLCDHMWATLFPAAEWLTCVGRIAFPIFAFMLVEGFFHTHDLRRYCLRLLGWAVVSEIPFNLMYAGSAVYPYHQNVLWTLLLSLLLITLLDRVRDRLRPALAAVVSAALIVLGYLAGYALMADYYGAGVLMVVAFYYFSQRRWWSYLGQLACLAFLNVELLGGYSYAVSLFGHELEIPQQGLALLALIPIWLYRGRQGEHRKGFQCFCYAFYPAHMLALVLIRGALTS